LEGFIHNRTIEEHAETQHSPSPLALGCTPATRGVLNKRQSYMSKTPGNDLEDPNTYAS